jgi:hypothetical protein
MNFNKCSSRVFQSLITVMASVLIYYKYILYVNKAIIPPSFIHSFKNVRVFELKNVEPHLF